jgi:hypothetical protein
MNMVFYSRNANFNICTIVTVCFITLVDWKDENCHLFIHQLLMECLLCASHCCPEVDNSP